MNNHPFANDETFDRWRAKFALLDYKLKCSVMGLYVQPRTVFRWEATCKQSNIPQVSFSDTPRALLRTCMRYRTKGGWGK